MVMSYSMASRVSSSSTLSPSPPFSSSVSLSSSSPQLPSSSFLWAQPPVQLKPAAPETESSPSNLPAEQ